MLKNVSTAIYFQQQFLSPSLSYASMTFQPDAAFQSDPIVAVLGSLPLLSQSIIFAYDFSSEFSVHMKTNCKFN